MLNGFHQPVSRDELCKSVLDDVLELRQIRHLAAYKGPQSWSLGGDVRGDPRLIPGTGREWRAYRDRLLAGEFIDGCAQDCQREARWWRFAEKSRG